MSIQKVKNTIFQIIGDDKMKNILIASICALVISATLGAADWGNNSAVNLDRKHVSPALYAEQDGNNYSPLIANKEIMNPFKFGWTEDQYKIDLKQTV